MKDLSVTSMAADVVDHDRMVCEQKWAENVMCAVLVSGQVFQVGSSPMVVLELSGN